MKTETQTLPSKLLKVTERVYGRTFYTSQGDIDRANQLGLALIRCRCRNGRLVSQYYAEMGWFGKEGAMVHRSYLEGATIVEIDVIQCSKPELTEEGSI
jgi:hypothetical protein